MDIYSWLVHQINFLQEVLKLKQNFQKNRVVLAKLRSLWWVHFVRHILFVLTKVSDGEVLYGNALFSILIFPIKKCYLPSKHINVESTYKQHWSSTLIKVISTLIFGWKWNLSPRTFIDVVSKLAKQRWYNVDRIKSIQRWWTNVVSTLKFDWKWKLSRRMFIDIVSRLTKQHWNNIDSITSIQRRRPNVVSALIVSWKWNLSQRIFIGVASTLRKQHLNNFINCCTNGL